MEGQLALPADPSSEDLSSLVTMTYFSVIKMEGVNLPQKREEAVGIADFKAVLDQE